MKAIITDEAALRAITPLAIRSYLEAEGWHKVGEGHLSVVYASPSSQKLIARLPVSGRVDDYAQVINRAITMIAEVEDRDEIAVYRDLTLSTSDVIRVSAKDADSDGAVALNAGVRLFEGARDMLLSAAAATVELRRSYHLGKMAFVEEYLNQVRLGQTEQSSFVVALISPVPPTFQGTRQTSLWPDLEEEPRERLIIRTLRTALDATRGALDYAGGNEMADAFELAAAAGVSANMCDSLAQVASISGRASVSVTWAKSRPTPEKRHAVDFDAADSEILREASKYFRAREPRLEETVLGYVTKTDRDESEPDGIITIKALIDGRPRSLRVELEKSDYELAAGAHIRQLPVVVTGELRPHGARWRLVAPRNFRVLPDDESGNI